MTKRRSSRPADPMSRSQTRAQRGAAEPGSKRSDSGEEASDISQTPSPTKFDSGSKLESGSLSTALGTRGRLLLTALVIFHLCAVVLPPLAVQTFGSGGPSPLIGLLIRPFEGYGQFLHLDRGYAFFAPDPGPSRLIQAAVVEPDGRIEETIYPDRDKQWPRLLYHRHFMLSEYLSEIYQPPGPPDEMFQTDRFGAELWQQARGRYEFIRQSMVDHLKSANDGKEVALRRLEHGLPALEDYRIEPIELTDPRLYSVLLDQPIFSDSIAPQESDSESDIESEPAEEIPAPDTPPETDASLTDASPKGASPKGAVNSEKPSEPAK